MEIELEPRVKPPEYKVKAMSHESLSQKAGHVVDTDICFHRSTKPCLLSHIPIYNKSLLEWEISVGLHYKTFVKVHPCCGAQRRDMIYPMNYTPFWKKKKKKKKKTILLAATCEFLV
ncbi:hypothetical protein D8674_020611 [Pyrus ussuriensis x Pyrus communis]|uniref:Uncharacterized protein n=1 Tax=Pyrus ussuriensis x Pyrus communis TaxID=2448454 RepID=A0A5N5HK44_9ROSA|nr:hypothetical protein D8674_020611 [Pyrus ussuriensis x Pyrus communis]